MISAELLELATRTDGDSYDTGLRLRGYEVHATPPHHYRHYTTFTLIHPVAFDLTTFLQEGRWVVGFLRPDGERRVTSGNYRSQEDAEHARLTHKNGTTARLGYRFEVGYKDGETWATKETGRPWGTVWAEEYDYQPMRFALTGEEACLVLAFREEVDAEWTKQSTGYLKKEAERTTAIARATALDGLPARAFSSDLVECLECGATFDQPGSVESGGMSCKRCS